MQEAKALPEHSDQRLTLAYVEDAHNVGCLVRFVGQVSVHRATYSEAIQQNGVVIRTCHLVVVDQDTVPPQVVWRIGTLGTILEIYPARVTLNLGYRNVTIPLRDSRPAAERERDLAVGDRVLLRGSPIEQATITDVLHEGELAHPEGLQAALEKAVERLRAAS
jgi:hypothetical protein